MIEKYSHSLGYNHPEVDSMGMYWGPLKEHLLSTAGCPGVLRLSWKGTAAMRKVKPVLLKVGRWDPWFMGPAEKS